MNSLEDLEKKINSELTTKVNTTNIKHNHLYIEIDKVPEEFKQLAKDFSQNGFITTSLEI